MSLPLFFAFESFSHPTPLLHRLSLRCWPFLLLKPFRLFFSRGTYGESRLSRSKAPPEKLISFAVGIRFLIDPPIPGPLGRLRQQVILLVKLTSQIFVISISVEDKGTFSPFPDRLSSCICTGAPATVVSVFRKNSPLINRKLLSCSFFPLSVRSSFLFPFSLTSFTCCLEFAY